MPWKEKTVVESRLDFIQQVEGKDKQAEGENKTFKQLCREFGISRKTGYKWLKRWKSGETLKDRSHAPLCTPKKTAKEQEDLILSLRDEHPGWGPRKLKRRLEDLEHEGIPAHSTIAAILQRCGRIDPRESEKHKPWRRFEREHPNELWQMDFKGEFPMEYAGACYPLTLLDDHSRYSLCLEAKESQKAVGVKASLDQLFSRFGLPTAILCDNGSPWGDVAGITRIDVWLMQLGILPIHIRPGHPQTQGKEERFHQTLKRELLTGRTFADIQDAQKHFEHWQRVYNNERPHEALGMDVPAKHYQPSSRAKPSILQEPDYPPNSITRKVSNKGLIRYEGAAYYVGSQLETKVLLLRQCEDAHIEVLYGGYVVARIDPMDQEVVSRRIARARP